MKTSSHIKLIYASVVLMALVVVINGQFFTKTGSKSIPRMGRRADNSLWSRIPSHPAYKQKVIEAILKKYNENNSIESDNSMTSSQQKSNDILDSNENDLKIKNQNSKTSSLGVEESGDQFNTKSEIRKLHRILSSFIHKTQNGL